MGPSESFKITPDSTRVFDRMRMSPQSPSSRSTRRSHRCRPPIPALRTSWLRTIRRRWIPIVTQWLILSVAMMTAAYVVIKPVYRASLMLRVDPSTWRIHSTAPDDNLDGCTSRLRSS